MLEVKLHAADSLATPGMVRVRLRCGVAVNQTN